MQVADRRTMASVYSMTSGSSRCSRRTSRQVLAGPPSPLPAGR